MAALLPPGLNNRLLPSELIEEIMLNLPHKSLVRFSAVSKSWSSMIFDPVFARKHKNLSRSHRLVLYMNRFREAGAVFSLAPISSDLRIKVITKPRRDGSDPSSVAEEAPIIAFFDLSTEKYGEVAVPHEYDADDNELKVVTLNGKLCAYVNYEDYGKKEARFVLWVMEEYGLENSWTKRFDIMLAQPSILGCTCLIPDTLTPLHLSDNNDLVVTIRGHCASKVYILMYRNGEAASRPLKIVKHEDYKADCFLYVESLITIDKFLKNR